MTPKERLTRQAQGKDVDRVPCLGGWINGVANLASLAGISADQYLANPLDGVVRANLALGVDGMILPIVPDKLESIRSGLVEEKRFEGIEAEAILEYANTLPDRERDVLADFDAPAVEKHYRDYFHDAFRKWRGLVPIPNFWEIGGPFPLYARFGYTAFFGACALYPEAIGKIWWARSLGARERSKILVRLYDELDLVPLMFCGEDLCTNQGPMVAPAFLREHYFPHVKMGMAPLVEAGVRLVVHCDGDVRPLVEDFLDLGFTGFQGFQYETGVDPCDLKARLRKRHPELQPLFFTGLSVTRTLPFGTPAEVRDEVDYFLDFTDGGRGMFLFTSNASGVEVPPENLRTAYEYVKTWDPQKPRTATRPKWPWIVSHPETTRPSAAVAAGR